MTDCDAFRNDFDAYRDRSLEAKRRQAINEHLRSCSACQQAIDAADDIERQIKSAAMGWSPSADLWPRIRQTAATKSRRGKAPRSLAAGLAAALVLVVGGFLALQQIDGQHTADREVATALVNEFHTFVISRRELDYRNDQPGQIRNWFGSKVDFRVPLPIAPTEVNLTGGRLCNMLDQRIVSFMYRVDGAWVSLYIMKSDASDAGRNPGREQSLRGYAYIDWQAQGLTYSLVGDIPAARLQRIAQQLYLPPSVHREPADESVRGYQFAAFDGNKI